MQRLAFALLERDGVTSLLQQAPREYPPEAPPALDLARIGFTLRMEQTGFAAIPVTAVAGARHPLANLRPVYSLGTGREVLRARRKVWTAHYESGHKRLFCDYSLIEQYLVTIASISKDFIQICYYLLFLNDGYFGMNEYFVISARDIRLRALRCGLA
jgi:hypothetical protein